MCTKRHKTRINKLSYYSLTERQQLKTIGLLVILNVFILFAFFMTCSFSLKTLFACFCLFIICLSLCKSMILPIYLPFCLSVFLPLFVSLSLCPFVSSSPFEKKSFCNWIWSTYVFLYVNPNVLLSSFLSYFLPRVVSVCLSIYVPVCLLFCLSIFLYMCLSVYFLLTF